MVKCRIITKKVGKGMAAMNYKFSDLVDIKQLNILMQSFYRATGIPSGIIDVDGNILVAIGWQRICQSFHRENLQAKMMCKQSDDSTKQNMIGAGSYFSYKCKNGLIDVAAPIIIDGHHVANVFQGQFLFEEPDFEYFKEQADRYGFDKEDYLAALAEVPIYTQEKLDGIMHFFRDLAEMIAELGFAVLGKWNIKIKLYGNLMSKFLLYLIVHRVYLYKPLTNMA